MHALRYVGSSPTLNQTAKISGLRRRRGGHASRKNLALSQIMVNQPTHGAGKSYRSAGPSTSTEGQFECATRPKRLARVRLGFSQAAYRMRLVCQIEALATGVYLACLSVGVR